jgi:plastocyanin domain-containing protein
MTKMIRRLALTCFLASALSATGAVGKPASKPKVQTAKITITTRGYEPSGLKFRKGIPVRVTFLRTTDATCVKEIVFPDFNIRRALPLNQPVVVSFTPRKRGTFAFVCGMNMMSGQLIVQ